MVSKATYIVGGMFAALLFRIDIYPNFSEHNTIWNSKNSISVTKRDGVFCSTVLNVGKRNKNTSLHKMCSGPYMDKDYYDRNGDGIVEVIHWEVFEPFRISNSFDELDRGSEYTKYRKEYVPNHEDLFEEADDLLENELMRFSKMLSLEGKLEYKGTLI